MYVNVSLYMRVYVCKLTRWSGTYIWSGLQSLGLRNSIYINHGLLGVVGQLGIDVSVV